ncbi:MAG: hypothetical protein ACTSX6_03320 [Candidatus Heimdallarchaeaceae archaeon]
MLIISFLTILSISIFLFYSLIKYYPIKRKSEQEGYNISKKLAEWWLKEEGEKIILRDFKRGVFGEKPKKLWGFIFERQSGEYYGKKMVIITNEDGVVIYLKRLPSDEELKDPFVGYTSYPSSPIEGKIDFYELKRWEKSKKKESEKVPEEEFEFEEEVKE